MQAIMIDLKPYYGFLKVSGENAASFLQGQLTCDIQKVNQTIFQLGGHCNLKGRLRSLFRLYKKGEDFLLQTPIQQLDFAASELKKYAKFSKVTIENIGDSIQAIGLLNIQDLEKFQTEYPITSQLDIVKMPHSEYRYQIVGPKAEIKNIMNAFLNTQIQAFEAWKLADIRDGLPEIWPELRELLLPHHIQLPKLGGVSFTKGCYCGQEIVARMEYRGNIKKTMIRGSLSNNPDAIDAIVLPGTRLYSQNESGEPVEVGLVLTTAKTKDSNTEMLLEISEYLARMGNLNIELQFGSKEGSKHTVKF